MSWNLNCTPWTIRDMRALPLPGGSNEWRLRVGRWRAIIELENSSGKIIILRVLPRDRAYR